MEGHLLVKASVLAEQSAGGAGLGEGKTVWEGYWVFINHSLFIFIFIIILILRSLQSYPLYYHPSIHSPIHPSIHLSIHPSIYLYILLFFPSIHLSVHPSLISIFLLIVYDTLCILNRHYVQTLNLFRSV